MHLKRFQAPAVAALGALLIAGGSIVLASDPQNPPGPASATEQPEGADQVDEAEQPEAAGEAAEVDEADEAPTYTSSITVDETTLPDGDEAAEAQTLANLPGLISKDEAAVAATAAVSGSVKESELEAEQGNVVWSVEILGADGTVTSVKIDAGNGTVLDTKVHGADEDDAHEADGA